jgi:hypothetical protein
MSLEDVHDTRRQCAKVTDQWAQGVAVRLAFELVRTKASWTHVYTRRERLWRWRKSVEAKLIGRPATWLGWPTATWWVTTSAKSLELPHGSINTPLPVKVDTHTRHFGDSTCKALFISVVARRNLVRRVARLWGPPYLSGALLVARAQKLCQNPS